MLAALTAAGFLFALGILLLTITTAAPAPPACPKCGRPMTVTSHPDATNYFCEG